MRFKSYILAGHRWAGLTIGLAAAFLALTGLTMAFRTQLEPRVDAALLARPACDARLPLETLAARASAVHPGKALQRFEIPDLRTAATVVRFADRTGVYLDPCSGEVLAQRTPWGGFFPFVEMVHKLRFITEDGKVTEVIGGTIAILVAIMATGGLILAWPASRRSLQAILRPRLARGTRAFDLLLHRSTGVYVYLVVVASMACSLTFTFDWMRSAIFAVTASAAPAKKPAAHGAMALPLEAYLARARALMPAMGSAVIALPRRDGEPVELYAVERGAPHAYARSYLYLDPANGETLRFQPYAESSIGNKAYRWMGALHTARAGIVPQIVLFLGILGVPVLGFTGIRSYLRARRAARSLERRTS